MVDYSKWDSLDSDSDEDDTGLPAHGVDHNTEGFRPSGHRRMPGTGDEGDDEHSQNGSDESEQSDFSADPDVNDESDGGSDSPPPLESPTMSDNEGEAVESDELPDLEAVESDADGSQVVESDSDELPELGSTLGTDDSDSQSDAPASYSDEEMQSGGEEEGQNGVSSVQPGVGRAGPNRRRAGGASGNQTGLKSGFLKSSGPAIPPLGSGASDDEMPELTSANNTDGSEDESGGGDDSDYMDMPNNGMSGDYPRPGGPAVELSEDEPPHGVYGVDGELADLSPTRTAHRDQPCAPFRPAYPTLLPVPPHLSLSLSLSLCVCVCVCVCCTRMHTHTHTHIQATDYTH
jgi:hypothetical protein